MGYGRKKSASSPETEAPALPDYHVTGDGNPDPNCNYYVVGQHDGQPYCLRSDGSFWIYYNQAADEWAIADAYPLPVSYWWSRQSTILGNYEPHGLASGIATVSAGGH